MARPAPLVPLLDALRDLAAWLRTAKVPGLVMGGVAVSLLGRPRVTKDVDAQYRWVPFMVDHSRLVNTTYRYIANPRSTSRR